MSDSEIKVAFNPSGQRGTFPRGTILLDAAKSLGVDICLLYTSPSPRDLAQSRMPSSA